VVSCSRVNEISVNEIMSHVHLCSVSASQSVRVILPCCIAWCTSQLL
jgi:hypothetical protein